MFRKYNIKNLDFKLIIAVLLITVFGILIIGSASEYNQKRQIIGMIIGLFVMIGMSIFDYNYFIKYFFVCYAIVIISLVLVLIPGVGYTAGGATRWIDIPGITRFQPSEMAKIFLVLFFAWFLSTFEEHINKLKYIVIMLALVGIPLVLIEKEPDLSTTIVTLLMVLAMIFISGISYKYVFASLGVVVPLVGMVIYEILRGNEHILDNYQRLRILSWLRPEEYPSSAYQQQNSIMAVGSGQLLGKGLYNESFDSVKNGNYISEPHTDFIFAVAGEETGFVGSAIIVLLLLFITVEILVIAFKSSDLAGKLICTGIGSLIGFQSFVNICVVTGFMPNTGLPLPFVSYGMTSLVTLYFAIGIVLNVGLQSKKTGKGILL